MKRRELLSGLAASALATGCVSQATSRAATSPARYGSPVPLPSPDAAGTISLPINASRSVSQTRGTRP